MAPCYSWIDDPNHWFSSAPFAQLSSLVVSNVLYTFICSCYFPNVLPTLGSCLHYAHPGISLLLTKLLILQESGERSVPREDITHPSIPSIPLLALSIFVFPGDLILSLLSVSVSIWKACCSYHVSWARDMAALSVTHFVLLTSRWRLFSITTWVG